MAYREFYDHTEPGTPPDYSPIANGISNLFSGIAKRRDDQQDLASKFKYDLKGGFESDNKILNELGKTVTQNAVKDIRRGGRVSPETQKLMSDGNSFAETSSIQQKRSDEIEKRIGALATKNKYYNPTNDLMSLHKVSDPDVNFQSRGKVLDDIEMNMNGTDSFMKDQYAADYVKDIQRASIEKTSGNPDSKNTIYNESTFWTPQGKPGVTDDHAIDFIKSNPDLDRAYDKQVKNELLEDIKKIKATGEPEWMKGLEDEEILGEMINDPNKNTINKKSFGERKRELGKYDLNRFNAINNKTSYEKKEPTGAQDGSGVTNDSIGHSYTYYNNPIASTMVSGLKGGPVQGQRDVRNISGPGGTLMIKKGVNPGRAITIEADSKNQFNYNTGRNTTRQGRGKLNLTGYQLVPYTTDGKVFPLSGTNQEELKQQILDIRLDRFKNLSPNMSVGLQGYTIDDSKMLGDIATRTQTLNEQLSAAVEENDMQKITALNEQIAGLNQLRGIFNLDGISDEDIMNAAAKSGIKSTRNDVLLRAEQSDMDKVRTITGGLNLKDRNKWSPEMKEIDDLWNKRWNEAQGAANAPAPTVEQPKKKTGATKVASQDEVNKLAPGTKFIWTDGQEYTKD